MQITLYLIRETSLARLYSKDPADKRTPASREFWVPRSIVTHTSKMGDMHIVTLPEWFIQKEKL